MKMKMKIATLVIGLCLLLGLSACETHASTTITYAVDTGDNISLTVDAKAGFAQDAQVPFSISKAGEQYLVGSFGTVDDYDYIRLVVENNDNLTILDEAEKDGNEYYLYSAEMESGSVEYSYVVKIADSSTCVAMTSLISEDAAREAFEAIVLEAVE